MNVNTALTQRIHKLWQDKGVLSTLLLPFSLIVCAYTRRKRQRFEKQPGLAYYSHTPVIVVGNLIVGGAGKTPLVMALIDVLRTAGFTPGVISRGYGAAPGPQPRTAKETVNAAEFGDEPALIHQQKQVPIAVHPKRALALKALNRDFPDVDVVISDDGLQHLALGRKVEIIVQDQRGIGNGRLLPAGPLREPASRLQKASLVITQVSADMPFRPNAQAPDETSPLKMRLWPTSFLHLGSGKRLTLAEAQAVFSEGPTVACAAIGQPTRFFIMLESAGFKLAATHPLPDHYDYSSNPFSGIAANFILITAKDAVKCKKFNDSRLWVVEVETQFSKQNWADPLLQLLAKP
ncbi:tetraacyldisaccharide 4'-kinase [Paenalcaligenes niemegkensis]|uniref:tetraacyldisaccharide 4'-kinase n=1 Tax=Paenalcaligenes niemegkensis TaxID=2895469 RepID=UPI001EE9ADEC|nr:tetraacyldisaccharide 4'-kinase [Paenalcaligenes niemegkensis]MCQ9616618.1 tetraacyldisaccharide 4'-kinase [Paenalcaligenes niemegkensis]